MQSVNEIVEAIHKLPSGEREKIRKLLEKEKLEKQKEVEEEIRLIRHLKNGSKNIAPNIWVNGFVFTATS